MVYRGHVENGMIRLEDASILPDGAEVEVHSMQESPAEQQEKSIPKRPTVGSALASLAGKAENLPPDAARNLDHYLYGHAKR